MSRLSTRQDQAVQAIGQVAQLGGLQIKKVTVADDLENVTLTVIFTGISQGWQQETLPFEVEDLRATVNGRYEVMDLEKTTTLQPGDLAETGAEADAEIEAAKGPAEDPDDEERKQNIHLVGEAAAVSRKRR